MMSLSGSCAPAPRCPRFTQSLQVQILKQKPVLGVLMCCERIPRFEFNSRDFVFTQFFPRILALKMAIWFLRWKIETRKIHLMDGCADSMRPYVGTVQGLLSCALHEEVVQRTPSPWTSCIATVVPWPCGHKGLGLGWVKGNGGYSRK